MPAWTRSSARGDAIRAMLCAPLWSGPAHVVALGSVGVTRRGHQSLQRPCDRAGSAPQQISDKQHIDEIEIRRCTHVCPRSDKLKTPTLRYPYRRSDWLQDGNTFKTNFSLPNAISTMIWSGFWIAATMPRSSAFRRAGLNRMAGDFARCPRAQRHSPRPPAGSRPTAGAKPLRLHWSTYERLRLALTKSRCLNKRRGIVVA